MKKIAIVNICITLLSLGILLVINTSENFFYIMYITGIIGWIFPFFNILLSSIVLLRDTHFKLATILNIVSFLLNTYIVILIIRVYNKSMWIPLCIYLLLLAITGIYIYYFYKKIREINSIYRENKKRENEEVKKAKKENNGIIK